MGQMVSVAIHCRAAAQKSPDTSPVLPLLFTAAQAAQNRRRIELRRPEFTAAQAAQKMSSSP